MRIAVDMDDVVLDFMGSVMDVFAREYGVVPVYDGQPWGQQAVDFTTHPLLLDSGYKDWWGWLEEREWLWATFPAIPGAIGGLKRLRADGHYVEAVTAKPTWAEHNVWKWLGKWRPPFNRVTIVSNTQSKLDVTEASIIVDDKRATCELFQGAGRRAIHFDRAAVALPDERIFVAHDWIEVVNTVRELAK